MATLKQRLHRKNGSTYDVVHLETESNVVMRPSGNTVETDLTNYLPKVQNSDDVPEGLKSGQICTGTTKVFVCTNDGTVRTFKEEGGGSSVPVPDVDFTYTGEYQVIDDSDGNWRIKFFTSGNFVPLKDLLIDVFLVGGGGGGADASSMSVYGNAGGGGGYTKTEKTISLTNNITYAVSIGSGGLGNNYYQSRSTTGGISSAFNINANGGNSKIPNTNAGHGVSGGSGSGAYGAVGGSDGSNGGSYGSYSGGLGQGTTTREFGETTGDLYAGGGGGGSNTSGQAISGGAGGGGSGFYYRETLASRDGEANTGGGGGGGYTPGAANASRYGGNGGSGIVIIRNHKSTSNLIPLSGDLTVGNTVTFDDKDWVVVHNDGNLWYLALSKIPENCRINSPGSTSNGKYAGSTIETKVTAWETANLSELALQFCEDVTVENTTHKVFLPTYTQVKTTFSHYAAAEANRICTVYINNTDTAYDWWLSTPAGSAYWYQVTNVGKLNRYSNTGSAAIRPHICIRYDA